MDNQVQAKRFITAQAGIEAACRVATIVDVGAAGLVVTMLKSHRDQVDPAFLVDYDAGVKAAEAFLAFRVALATVQGTKDKPDANQTTGGQSAPTAA